MSTVTVDTLAPDDCIVFGPARKEVEAGRVYQVIPRPYNGLRGEIAETVEARGIPVVWLQLLRGKWKGDIFHTPTTRKGTPVEWNVSRRCYIPKKNGNGGDACPPQ